MNDILHTITIANNLSLYSYMYTQDRAINIGIGIYV